MKPEAPGRRPWKYRWTCRNCGAECVRSDVVEREAPARLDPHTIAHDICQDSCRRWRLALESGLIQGEVENREHGPECRRVELAIKAERGE